MSKPKMKIAQLDEQTLARVQKMEEQLEVVILALEPHYPLAALTEEQLEKLQAMEDELGVVLLAYRE